MSVNFLTYLNDQAAHRSGSGLDLVRLGSNETPIVPFTPDGDEVRLHYCDEPEIAGYVKCADPKDAGTRTCLLCLIGKAVDERLLLPVYLPAEDRIGVLAASKSMRPGSLLPQLAPVLKSEAPVVVLVARRDKGRYDVSVTEPAPGAPNGTRAITDYSRKWKAGQVDLTASYHQLDGDMLTTVPAIDTMLKIKKVGPYAPVKD